MNSIIDWVNQDIEQPPKDFREAIHTILVAISHSPLLRDTMVIKGGILIAIFYKGIRYTKDIDFSTEMPFQEFEMERFLDEFKRQLLFAVHFLDYDLDCRLQTYKIQPSNRPDASFPSLRLTIGYAYKGSSQHKRLAMNRSSKTIPIDLSFNEKTHKIEHITIINTSLILAYSLTDLIAEKYRAILQQEIRNRNRRQDIFDLYFLFQQKPKFTKKEMEDIHASLVEKSASRDISVNADSMNTAKIRNRCKKEYHSLKDDILGDLPSFDFVYDKVLQFYRSLPW